MGKKDLKQKRSFFTISFSLVRLPRKTDKNVNIELAQGQRNTKISGLFAQYGKRLLAFIRSRISDLETAEDVAQDVWLQLSRQEDLDAIEQVGSWLFTAARNRITDVYRKRKNIPFSQFNTGKSADADEEDDAAGDLSFDQWAGEHLPDAILESREFWDELNRALDQLPAEQREVFVAHELEGIPFKQMAEETGLSINTLLARKRYAVLYLRRHFGAA